MWASSVLPLYKAHLVLFDRACHATDTKIAVIRLEAEIGQVLKN